MPVPVLLDCDPGHDDVFAIWLAAGNEQIDLRGVTGRGRDRRAGRGGGRQAASP